MGTTRHSGPSTGSARGAGTTRPTAGPTGVCSSTARRASSFPYLKRRRVAARLAETYSSNSGNLLVTAAP